MVKNDTVKKLVQVFLLFYLWSPSPTIHKFSAKNWIVISPDISNSGSNYAIQKNAYHKNWVFSPTKKTHPKAQFWSTFTWHCTLLDKIPVLQCSILQLFSFDQNRRTGASGWVLVHSGQRELMPSEGAQKRKFEITAAESSKSSASVASSRVM